LITEFQRGKERDNMQEKRWGKVGIFSLKAARVRSPRESVILQDVDEPEPKGKEVVVRITGSGVCHSDLHIIDGELERVKYPLTIGHEPSGYVYKVGTEAADTVRTGEKVVVYPTFGCGVCRHCLKGNENLCQRAISVGFETDGSHAEYLLVKSPRYLYPISQLQPSEAASLSCAGVTVYSAIKNYIIPNSYPGSFVLVIGVGGLGHIAVQILGKLTPAQVIAVDVDERKLRMAEELGVEYAILGGKRSSVAEEITRIGGNDISAVIDFVGTDETLRLGYDSLGIQGNLVVIGAGGGILEYRGPDPKNRKITGPIMGSLIDMKEIVEMAEEKKFLIKCETFNLTEIGKVLEKIRYSEIVGRAVVHP
jgi:propanol-preferring alcohol dehydrogenase